MKASVVLDLNIIELEVVQLGLLKFKNDLDSGKQKEISEKLIADIELLRHDFKNLTD